MARKTNQLSAITVDRLKRKGLHHDGAGLYLRVTDNSGKFWVFRFMLHGKAREMGLGPLHALSLSEARQRAAECRKMLTEGKDPIGSRDAVKAQAVLAAAKEKTFKECAKAYIDAHKAGWRNPKHIQQWGNTLEAYVYPVFGSIGVHEVDVALVTKALEPIWKTKTETASRLRGRIEVILDWARARGYRSGENPARWKGHLDNLLAPRAKVQRVEHQPALPYDRIGDFMASVAAQEVTGAKALAFTILTATRTSEVIGATWDEIDLVKKIWVIPKNRIKAGREHRVPLSQGAIDLLESLKSERDEKTGKKTDFVFPSQRKGKPLSNMAMLALLKRMEYTEITVHGFRSTFRDWAAEQTNFPREVAEAALAHAVGDKVEAAYRRGDLFEKRRQLMDAWARYCATPSVKAGGNVTPMRRRG